MLIIPTILTDDISEFTSMEQKAEGVVGRIQIDVIDNKFAANSTIDPSILHNLNLNLDLDFHLMVKSPIDWIEHCLRAETEGVVRKDRVIGQIEMMENQGNFVDKVTTEGRQAGLAVDLSTPVDKLDQAILTKIAVVLLMSVPAGFGGQEFHLDVWKKIEKMSQIRNELNANFKICVDGGVTKELIRDMEKMGVDEVTVGKRIFEPDLKENLKEFNS